MKTFLYVNAVPRGEAHNVPIAIDTDDIAFIGPSGHGDDIITGVWVRKAIVIDGRTYTNGPSGDLFVVLSRESVELIIRRFSQV